MRSNPIFKLVFCVVLVGTVLVPGVSSAEREEREVKEVRQNTSSVCGRIDGIAKEMLREISGRSSKLEEQRREGRGHIEDDRMSLDALRSKNRVQGDANAERQFKVLERMATTTEARAAVQAFREAVFSALATRRLAFDRILAEYRNSLDQAITERKARIDAARTAMERDVQAELGKVKAACGSRTATAETKTALIASLRAIQDRFQSERQTIERLSESLDDLVERKLDTFRQADAILRTSLENARGDFERTFFH